MRARSASASSSAERLGRGLGARPEPLGERVELVRGLGLVVAHLLGAHLGAR